MNGAIPGVIRKYAEALLDVAAEQGQERGVHNGLLAFSELLNSHPHLKETLGNPAFSFSAKRNIVQKIAERLDFPPIAVNFVLVLMVKARLHQFPEALEAYELALDERSGVLRGAVSSSRELGGKEKEGLQERLSRVTGQRVKISYDVDASLIGGVKLRVGSIVFDGSIRTQLEEIRRRLAS